MFATTLVVIMIATPVPAEPAAAKSPTSVLVLASGAALQVRSYTVDGHLLRATALDGAPLIMRASKVDLDASAAATALLRQEEPEPAATPRPAPRRQQTLLEASAEAIASGKRGSYSQMGEASRPSPIYDKLPEKPQEPRGARAGGAADAEWTSTHIRLQSDVERLNGRAEHWRGRLADSRAVCQKLGSMNSLCALERINIQKWEDRLEPIETDLAAARRALSRFEARARRAGVELGD